MNNLSLPKKYLKLFAGCVLVQGVRRTVVVDTQRGAHFFIPNDLHTLLGPEQCLELSTARAAYPQHGAIIDQYVEFLLQHELAFLTNEPERFPVLDLSFRTPEPITNAIIDLDAASNFDLRPLVSQLDALKCKALQLRLSHAQTCAELTELLSLFSDSVLRSLDVYVPFDTTYTRPALEELSRAVPRLTTLYLYDAAVNAAHWYRRVNLRVVYVQQPLAFPGCCGVVQPHYFTYSIGHLTEAVSYNSCLNRKISVDARGNIKNCPSMQQVYGNVRTITLGQALAQPQFAELGSIAKSQVKVCQDCEFRLVCTDCRAYLEDPTDQFSKPLKCGYDPYTAQWADWSTHPLKQPAISFYGLEAALGKS